MKFKTKAICTVLAALMAAPAAATIRGPDSGDGELFFTLIDRDPFPEIGGDDSRSYTLDLGLTISQFLPTPTGTGVTAPGYTLAYAPDALLATFLGQVTEPARRANLVWNIGAMDSVLQNRYLTTAKAITDDQIPTNQALRTFDDNTVSYLSQVNTKGTHPGGDAVNGSSTATVADLAAFGGSANWGNNWAGSATFDNTAKMGESTSFFLLANTSNSGSATLRANLTAYANDFGNATWSFADDGTLTYMAPVPEPGEWALMLSGLGVIAWAARRRKRATNSARQ